MNKGFFFMVMLSLRHAGPARRIMVPSFRQGVTLIVMLRNEASYGFEVDTVNNLSGIMKCKSTRSFVPQDDKTIIESTKKRTQKQS
jgi:hypothetical protein